MLKNINLHHNYFNNIMIYLLLTILASTSFIFIFKLFEKFKVNNFFAISINYMVVSIISIIYCHDNYSVFNNVSLKWLIFAILFGVLFIGVFYMMVICTQKVGIAITAIANKMSLIIPVVFAFYFYNDSTTIYKVSGIMLALLAVYLTSLKQKNTHNQTHNNSLVYILPILIFIGSGIVDTSLKFVQTRYTTIEDFLGFFSITVGISTIIGFALSIYTTFKTKTTLGSSSFVMGTMLGVINFGSIFFLYHSLLLNESSYVFSILNIGVVILSALGAIIFFKEKLSVKNWVGILFGILAILLINFNV